MSESGIADRPAPITLSRMSLSRISFLIASAVAVLLFASSPLRADEGGPGSLDEVHKILRQAVGDSEDSAPAPDQQKALVGRALDMIHRLPHVYHGELIKASRDLEAALDELTRGDAAHKARSDILDADDLIRSIM
jgi:hypothetical protein